MSHDSCLHRRAYTVGNNQAGIHGRITRVTLWCPDCGALGELSDHNGIYEPQNITPQLADWKLPAKWECSTRPSEVSVAGEQPPRPALHIHGWPAGTQVRESDIFVVVGVPFGDGPPLELSPIRPPEGLIEADYRCPVEPDKEES